jgi:hypothetical protein
VINNWTKQYKEKKFRDGVYNSWYIAHNYPYTRIRVYMNPKDTQILYINKGSPFNFSPILCTSHSYQKLQPPNSQGNVLSLHTQFILTKILVKLKKYVKAFNL